MMAGIITGSCINTANPGLWTQPMKCAKTRPNFGGNQVAQYVIFYLGGNQPSSPEEGKKHFSKYMSWISSLGEAAVSPANPLKDTNTISSDGTVTTGGSSTISGYTIIEANSMDAALSIARACPFLEIGGSLEVSELIEMPG